MTTVPSTTRLIRRSTGNQLPSITMLAIWQVRRIWRLLLLTALGMLAAVIIACTIPLYSRVTMSAGIRDTLNTPADNSYIIVHSVAHQLSPSLISGITQQMDDYFTQNLGKYTTTAPILTIRTGTMPFISGDGALVGPGAKTFKDDSMQLIGMDINATTPHVTIIKGRLPDANSQQLEIALRPEVAQHLKADVGSQIILSSMYNLPDNSGLGTLRLPLRVVGLFKEKVSTDPFWHGTYYANDALKQGFLMKALVSNEALEARFGKIGPQAILLDTPDLIWYYHLDTTRIDATNMDDLVNGLNNIPVDVPTFTNNPPAVDQASVVVPSDVVQAYRDRISVAQIPIAIFAVLIVGLLLFFQSIMAELLVDQQSSTIALLRSRGSSGRQIFSAFVIQSLVLGMIALIAGPLLAIPVATMLVQRTLAQTQQGALNLISGDAIQVALGVRWLALAVVACSVITMILSIHRVTKYDVLALRREAARTTRRPFWQRFYLDMIAILVSIVAYGFSLYLQNTGLLDPQTSVLLASPLTLVSCFFFLVGCAMVLIRFFPLLLQLGGKLTTRSRNVAPMLALAQMSRSPYQSIRMTLLLMFATTFIIFTMIFSASQSQHILDVASYQTGADFSGNMGGASSFSLQPLQDQINAYQKISGVSAASVGYNTTLHTSVTSDYDVAARLLAVDPQSFVKATIWPEYSSLTNPDLVMKQLTGQRSYYQQFLPKPTPTATTTKPKATAQAGGTAKATASATPQASGTAQATATATTQAITIGIQPGNTTQGKPKVQDRPLPAIVDDSTWNALRLTMGKPFNLSGIAGPVIFVPIARVSHLPTVNDKAPNSVAEHGVMVDFASYKAVYEAASLGGGQSFINSQLQTNYAWLRAKSDARSLSSVRNAITKGRLLISPLYDRYSIIAQGRNDPLYLDIAGVLTLGALAPILLALVCNLIASWSNVRGRLTNFAMLRALGTTPSQIASILTWEQCLIYTCAIGLGTGFGLLLAKLTLPAMSFTSAPQSGVTDQASTGSGNFFAMQNVPPIQMLVPNSLLLVIGTLILISIIVLGLMVYAASRPTLGQALRLNED